VRFKASASDFAVEEIARLPLADSGAFTLYRVQKRRVTTLQVQAELATALGVPLSAVAFPALKDRNSQATQYGTVHGDGPPLLETPNFRAERIGTTTRPLSPRDLLGNRFTVVVHDLSSKEAAALPMRLAALGQFGLPNYFDSQRFGSYAPGRDWVGKRVLLRDAEGALRTHLAELMVGDPPPVRTFKDEAQRHWGEWRYLLEVAPKPSNFRSVLTFLADHPDDYRRALNLVTPRLLSLYLAAYGSLLWNRLAARYLAQTLGEAGIDIAGTVEVVDEALPLYSVLPPAHLYALKAKQVPLFHHRMGSADARLRALVDTILAQESLERHGLKVRILKRAYLPSGTRALLVFPMEIQAGEATADEATPRRHKLTISFALPRGSYATLLLKVLGLALNPGDARQEANDQ